jgi:carboxymethylenebutenolidase
MEDGFVEYLTKGERAKAFFSNPKLGSPVGQAIVIHEVWGFTEFIRDVCERLSQQGFCAAAPVLYWRDEELFSPDRIREGMKAVWGLTLEERYHRTRLDDALRKRRASKETASMLRTMYDRRFRARLLGDLRSLASALMKDRPDLRVGAIGFSLGGKLAIQLAGSFPQLAACVAFSAAPVLGATLGKVRSPILLLYGSEDRFMMRDVPAFVKQAVEKGKELELKVYRTAGHEFFDHTNRREFRPEAAEEAWERSTAFLKKNLSVDVGRDLTKG